MQKKTDGISYHSPDKLLTGFTKGRILFWGAMALAIHVVFIGGTSIGYIGDTWIDPDGAKERKEAAAAQAKANAENEAPKPVASTNSTTTAKTASTVSGVSTGADQELLDQRKDTPMVKRVTEKAESGEIPPQPNDIGISIEDTNTR